MATFGRKLWRGDVNALLQQADGWYKQEITIQGEAEKQELKRQQEAKLRLRLKTPPEKLEHMCSNPDVMNNLKWYRNMSGQARKAAILNVGTRRKPMTPKQRDMVCGVYKECVLGE